LAEEGNKIRPGSTRDVKATSSYALTPDLMNNVKGTLRLAGNVCFNVGIGFLDVVLNIKGISRGFRDSDTVIEGGTSRYGTHSNNNSPCSVSGQSTLETALAFISSTDKSVLESNSSD